MASFDKFEFHSEVLERGSFGEVIKGSNKSTNEQVAIKQMRTKYQKYFDREVAALKKVKSCEYFIKMHLSGLHLGSLCIVMELCNVGDLEKALDVRNFPESKLISFIHQITAGVHFIHTLDPPYIHRDLKSENVLLKVCYAFMSIHIANIHIFVNKLIINLTSTNLSCIVILNL